MNLLFIFFQRKVVWCKEEQHHIIKFFNDGNDISNEANALSGHIGISSITEHIQNRFFFLWNVSECDNFQKAKTKIFK